MEPISTAITIASVVGIFTATIECFDFIRLGSAFGRDYGNCLLRLDLCKLRLSRWGFSVGLNEAPQFENLINPTGSELIVAHQLLSAIQETFEDVEKASRRHRSLAIHDTNENFLDETSSLDAPFKRLHISMRKVAASRQAASNMFTKAAWAIYRKKEFDTLTDEITKFVNQLVDLFPTSKAQQSVVAASDINQIHEVEDLRLLRDISEQCDPLLKDAIQAKMPWQSSTYNQAEATGHSRIHAGDIIGYGVAGHGHLYISPRTLDNAVGHFGNIYNSSGDVNNV